jgi:hypothetical protein
VTIAVARFSVAFIAVALIGTVLWDAFEAIVLPRRVTRRWRLARLFYRLTWSLWAAVARRIGSRARRESFLGVFGPLSLLFLLALWAASLVLGFGALQWSLGTTLHTLDAPASFGTYLYLSGTTFFTLGLGDVAPRGPLARSLTVVESGVGFGFLALVIGYFPVLYNAFSRREVSITLLDPRAGSPPTVDELLLRHGRERLHHLDRFLHEWEKWTAELMESHLSYPVLAYFRSQHAHQSWLAALTTVLDSCALLMACVRDESSWEARVTFAMARHAVVDLAQVFRLEPRAPSPDRLSPADAARLFRLLGEAGRPVSDTADAAQRLADLRGTYEPYVNALAERLLMPLPNWTSTRASPARAHADN